MDVDPVRLQRHVPRLALDWLRDAPSEPWRVIPGTLCFADISGFTKLAERLAQRGRQGGEELVETLSRVFGDMLNIAHDNGGDLLKFGGDALLLFFSGEDHALRAANSAVLMRSALSEAAKIRTSVGKLNLRMSIGLHSGAVHFFLVGTLHRELLVLGPAASAIIATEGAASAGQILVSADTVGYLPPQATKRVPGGAELRWRRPRPVGSWRLGAEPVDQSPAARQLFPEHLGEYLASTIPDPEHRVACIAFMRGSGTDGLLEQAGPGALAEALQQTIGTAQQIFDEEGVTLLAVDIDQDGFKLFTGAGVPVALEDDEGVMLRAARRIADARLPIGLQIGISRGHVFAAEVGTRRRAAYSAMGDTTNTAARICAKAPMGRIYAHPRVLDESLTTFEVQASDPLTMKGKAEPLVVYDVGELTGVREREGFVVEEFVGRGEELSRLRDHIANLQSGTGSVLAIVGESGIGKTRLVEEVLASFPQAPALALRPEPYASTRPYRAVREPMRTLLGIHSDEPSAMRTALVQRLEAVDPDLVAYAALVGDVVQVDVEPSAEVRDIEPQFRAARIGVIVVEILTKLRPGVQIFTMDDAHWCDDASAQLFAHIADASARFPWLVLATRRATTGGYTPVEQMVLGPMQVGDMRTLIGIATEAAPLRPHELDLVVERASGNPLFATEIVQAARESSSFESFPVSLEAALVAKVDALDGPAKSLLRYASILGRSFPVSVLERVMALDGEPLDIGVAGRLDEFLDADGDRWRFRNGVIRDSIYEAMAFRVRARLHRMAAQAIEHGSENPTEMADILATHFSYAGDHRGAWTHGLVAARRAKDAYANADAAKLYTMALTAARRLPDIPADELTSTLTDLGEVQVLAGLFDESTESFGRAYRSSQQPITRADLLVRKARVKDRTGALSSALGDLTHARTILETENGRAADAMRAGTMAQTANILYALDRPGRARRQADEAADLARETQAMDPLGQALIVAEICSVSLDGASDGSRLKEALAIFEDLGDQLMQADVLSNLGFICAHAGRWDEGLGWLSRSRDLYVSVGDAISGSWTALNLSEMLLKQRRWDEAEAVLRDIIRNMRAANYDEGVHRAEMQLGRILIERSDYAEADAMLARVAKAFYQAGQPLTALEAVINRAFGLRRQGDAEAAVAVLDAAVEAAGSEAENLLPNIACERAPALAELGRVDEADLQLGEAEIAAQAFELPYEQAMLMLAQLEVDRAANRRPDLSLEQAANALLAGFGVAG